MDKANVEAEAANDAAKSMKAIDQIQVREFNIWITHFLLMQGTNNIDVSFLLKRPESIGIARTHRQKDPSEERGQALAAEQ